MKTPESQKLNKWGVRSFLGRVIPSLIPKKSTEAKPSTEEEKKIAEIDFKIEVLKQEISFEAGVLLNHLQGLSHEEIWTELRQEEEFLLVEYKQAFDKRNEHYNNTSGLNLDYVRFPSNDTVYDTELANIHYKQQLVYWLTKKQREVHKK